MTQKNINDLKNPFVGFTKPLFLLPKKKNWLELVEIGGRSQLSQFHSMEIPKHIRFSFYIVIDYIKVRCATMKMQSIDFNQSAIQCAMST
jgi:hypothetical protein